MPNERALGSWILPQPKEKDRYVPIPRGNKNQRIPFGYRQDENDFDWFVPVPLELHCLEQAKKYLKKYSYKDVAAWLSTQTGRKIDGPALRNRLGYELQRHKLKNHYRALARGYKAALKKAEKYEQRLGKKEATGYFESDEYLSLFRDNDEDNGTSDTNA